MSENPNTNCLEGMRCPNCGSYGPFHIDVTISVLVLDSGAYDEGGDYEWHGHTHCRCHGCNHDGTVATFTEPEDETVEFREIR